MNTVNAALLKELNIYNPDENRIDDDFPIFHEPFNLYCILYHFLGDYCGTKKSTSTSKFKVCYVQLGDIIVRFSLQKFSKYTNKLNFTPFNSSLALFIFLIYFKSLNTREMFKHAQYGRFDFVLKNLLFLAYLAFKKKIYFIYKSKNDTTSYLGVWPVLYEKFDILYDSRFNANLVFYVDLKHNKFRKLHNVNNIRTVTYNKAYLYISNKFYNFTYVVYNNIMYYSNNFIKICNKTRHSILFIRKQKCFNKGRYSRNRQLYRTGVYWCLYINIIALVGLNYLFYKFTINFMLYWWSFFITLNFFIIPQVIKNNLYKYSNIKNILYSCILIYSRIFELIFTFFFKSNVYLHIIFLQKKIYNFFFFLRNLFI